MKEAKAEAEHSAYEARMRDQMKAVCTGDLEKRQMNTEPTLDGGMSNEERTTQCDR